jgi:chromosome partitioning protein
MPVIAVINRKGGSGKSTVAAHLAAWMARQGVAVMLGDVDRQQSTRTWLKRRDAALPAIMPWAIEKQNILKVPVGVTHVVLDTPGGIHGFELARVIMSADAVIMPVCSSMFDRESAQACHAELMALPRVASGRCKLGIVGMRIDARTRAGQVLRDWAHTLNVPFLGVLRETQLYVKCLENGQTLFDIPPSAAVADLSQWEPILEWLRPITKIGMPKPAEVPPAPAVVAPPAAALSPNKVPMQPFVRPQERINAPRAASLMPAQEALVHGDRLSIIAAARPAGAGPLAEDDFALARPSRARGSGAVPHFLLRH